MGIGRGVPGVPQQRVGVSAVGLRNPATIDRSVAPAVQRKTSDESGRHGPAIEAGRAQQGAYGTPITRPYGKGRISGTIVWASDAFEVYDDFRGAADFVFEQMAEGVFQSFAVLICAGPIDGILRIWADSKIILDLRGAVGSVDPVRVRDNANENQIAVPNDLRMRIYLGTEEQSPDPTIERYEGAGVVPGHRGYAYVVFTDFPLSQFGNRLPSFSFEISTSAVETTPFVGYDDFGASDLPTDYLVNRSDNILLHPDGVHVVISGDKFFGDAVGEPNRDGQWLVVNLANGVQELYKQELFGDHGVERAPYVGDTDMDERGLVYVGRHFFTFQTSSGAVIEATRLEALHPLLQGNFALTAIFAGNGAGGDAVSLMGSTLRHIRVCKNQAFPLCAVIECGLDEANLVGPWRGDRFTIKVFNRDDLFLRLAVLPTPGAGLVFMGMAWDHARGELWCVLANRPTDAGGVKPLLDGAGGVIGNPFQTTVVVKYNTFTLDSTAVAGQWDITEHIHDGYLIAIDPLTDQVIVGTQFQDYGVDTRHKCACFDRETMAFRGAFDPNELNLAPNPFGEEYRIRSAWQQGPVNGFFYFASGDPGFLYRFDLVDYTVKTYEINTTLDNGYPYVSAAFGGSIYVPTFNGIFRGGIGQTEAATEEDPDTSAVWWMHLLDRNDPQPVLVGDIVSDISARVGLPALKIDVVDLDMVVLGYMVNDRMRAREALEPLADAFCFDKSETDGVLWYRLRGAFADWALLLEQLGAHRDGESSQQRLITNRTAKQDLPRRIEVAYSDPLLDYAVVTQDATRASGETEALRTARLPIVMTKDEARRAGDRALVSTIAQGQQSAFSLTRAFGCIAPADVATLDTTDRVRDLRVESIDWRGGIIGVQVADEEPSAYDSVSVGVAPDPPGGGFSDPGPTIFIPMDVPLLSDANDRSGIYYVVAGYTERWIGATIFRSGSPGRQPLGSPWQFSSRDATVGIVQTALGDVADPWVWDEANTIDVVLSAGGTLVSADEDAVLGGTNWAMVGNEIIAFREVEAVDQIRFRLSGLLRARFGTDWATDEHVDAEPFVLLEPDLLNFVVASWQVMRDEEFWYLAVSANRPFIPIFTQSHTHRFRLLMPLSPKQLVATRDASNNLAAIWSRRSRRGGQWDDGVEVPLAEAEELYEVDCYAGPGIFYLSAVPADPDFDDLAVIGVSAPTDRVLSLKASTEAATDITITVPGSTDSVVFFVLDDDMPPIGKTWPTSDSVFRTEINVITAAPVGLTMRRCHWMRCPREGGEAICYCYTDIGAGISIQTTGVKTVQVGSGGGWQGGTPSSTPNVAGAEDDDVFVVAMLFRNATAGDKSVTIRLGTTDAETTTAFPRYRRTVETTTPAVAYTAAEITADGGTPALGGMFEVFQMSATVGRGFGSAVGV